MLVIRMQRTGRKGHAMFRVVVQDSRRTPTSGKIVAALGSYDPHTKAVILNKEKAAFYLEHGAQPSPRVARLLKAEGVALPAWVATPGDKTRTTRNADKRRSTAPAPEVVEEASVEAPEAPAEEVETAAEEVAVEAAAPEETPAVDTAEDAPETPAEETAKPADDPAAEPEAEAAETPAE